MKKAFFILILTLVYSSPALANRIVKCESADKVLDCLYSGQPDPNMFGETKVHKLDESIYLVLIHSIDMSGAYNPYYAPYFYDSKTKEINIPYADDNFLVAPAIDEKNLVLATSNRGSSSGATGTIEFFKIDPKAMTLYPLKTFRTDTKGDVKPDGLNTPFYYNADNDRLWVDGKPCGHMGRANKYIKENNYNLPVYTPGDSCLAGE